MSEIYEGDVPSMFDPQWQDSGLLPFKDDSGALRFYPVGRMSDRVIFERIKQFAPFNLVDGAWLNNILTVGPSNIVQSHLFAIWSDEAGNGVVSQNHANVYSALLQSANIYLPPIQSSEFIASDFLPGAFTQAVFELSVGKFPREYFPELLGMTLYLEWEATPTLWSIANLLAGRNINPLFYQLHVAIDNIKAGHGFLAKDAIKLYLNEIHESGGDGAVQLHWKRIWNGYVTWATVGGLGNEFIERSLILDKKSINRSSAPGVKDCWPDIAGYYRKQMVKLVESKASVAAEVHKGRFINGRPLDQLFSNPDLLLDSLRKAGFVNPDYPRDSRFMSLLEFDGPMYKVFTDDEKNIILDWIESLRDHKTNCVDPIESAGNDAANAMENLIKNRAKQAKHAHTGFLLTDRTGQVIPLVEFFDNPSGLMAELVNCGWVVPGNPARSMFLQRIASNGGPMDGVFSADEISIITNWIADGAKRPTSAVVARSLEKTPPKLAQIRHLIGAGAVH
jgi:hypothetical protein